MELRSENIVPGTPINQKYALGKADSESHATFSANVSPQLSWSGAPEATRSFALVMHDTEAPTVPDNVNKEGRTVPHDLPRADFFHWVLVDIPSSTTELAEGAFSSGVTYGGKPGPTVQGAPTHLGDLRHGVNSYTDWFAGDPDMAGAYFGYDGPFPPWNDERTHSYTFTLYALDVDRAPVTGTFDGPTLLTAISAHILDTTTFTATYRIAEAP